MNSALAIHKPAQPHIGLLLTQLLAQKDGLTCSALYDFVGDEEQKSVEKLLSLQPRIMRQLAAAAYTPQALLDWLAKVGDSRCLDALASNQNLSKDLVTKLALSATGRRRLRLARHKQATPSLLSQWASTTDPELRIALCANTNAEASLLQDLAQACTLAEAKCIATQKQTNSPLLQDLWHAFDDVYLHASLAANGHLPETLRQLAVKHKEALVRRKVAQNPHLSDGQWDILSTDPDPQVRASAVRYMGQRAREKQLDSRSKVRRLQARKQPLSPQQFVNLSQDEDVWVRRWLARNLATPIAILEQLAQDQEMQVRRGVGRNQSTPASLLTQLANDPEDWVRAAIAYRTDIEVDLIMDLSHDNSIDVLAGLAANEQSFKGLLSRLALHKNADIRRAVINNIGTEGALLTSMANDPYSVNRQQLCGHPALALATLWELTEDPDVIVRFAAVRAIAQRWLNQSLIDS